MVVKGVFYCICCGSFLSIAFLIEKINSSGSVKSIIIKDPKIFKILEIYLFPKILHKYLLKQTFKMLLQSFGNVDLTLENTVTCLSTQSFGSTQQ